MDGVLAGGYGSKGPGVEAWLFARVLTIKGAMSHSERGAVSSSRQGKERSLEETGETSH